MKDFQEQLNKLVEDAKSLENPLQIVHHLKCIPIGNNLYLRRKGFGAKRILVTCKSVDGEPVLAFHEVLTHEDQSYEKFYQNRDTNPGVDAKVHGYATDDDRRRCVREARANEESNVVRTPPLPEHCEGWFNLQLDLASTLRKDEHQVYESRLWVEYMAQDDMDDYREAVHDLLVEVLTRQNLFSTSSPCIVENEEVWIAYQALQHGSQRAIHLMRVGNETPPTVGELGTQKLSSHIIGDIDQIARKCRRAYSQERLIQKDAWLALEATDKPSLDPCLPLSQEEFEVLENLQQGKEFPLFIDGPAGSGKSTLLTYYIAELLDYRKEMAEWGGASDTIASPLFVTFNDKLREETQNRVVAHLCFHFKWSHAEAIEVTQTCFFTTRALFRSLLTEEAMERFEDTPCVRFSHFLKWFKDKYVVPPVSAEEAWFVIRSFIKGRATCSSLEGAKDSEFNKDDFQLLHEKSRDGLSEEDFATVYDKVWPDYRDWLHKHNRWDDQDLCLAVLTNKLQPSEMSQMASMYWTAVVCDEAQDLTYNDLRLLFRLLGHTRYNLTRRANPSIPFIFAADPLQTINPSGFRWEGFTSLFFEETALLFGRHNEGVRSNIQRLQWNYRSTPHVVDVTQAIQGWRNEHLNRSRAGKVLPWNQDKKEGGVVRLVMNEDNAQDFQELLTKLQVIVPCAEGQRLEYVTNDALLRKVFGPDCDEEDVAWVNSPMTVKGLEYPYVVMFGFGEKLNELWEWKKHEKRGQIRKTCTLKQLDFALNSLYVAATRARVKLYFIDRADHDDLLWGPVGIASYLQNFVVNDPVNPKDIQLVFDPLEHFQKGQETLKQAKVEQSPELCLSAARHFELGGHPKEARHARAWHAFFSSTDNQLSLEVTLQFQQSKRLEALEEYLWNEGRWEGFLTLQNEFFPPASDKGHIGRQIAMSQRGHSFTLQQLPHMAEGVLQWLEKQPANHQKTSQLFAQFLTLVQDATSQAPLSTTSWLPRTTWNYIQEACSKLHQNKKLLQQARVAYLLASSACHDDMEARRTFQVLTNDAPSSEDAWDWALRYLRLRSDLWWLPTPLFRTVAQAAAQEAGLQPLQLFEEQHQSIVLTPLLSNEEAAQHASQHLHHVVEQHTDWNLAFAVLALHRRVNREYEQLQTWMTQPPSSNSMDDIESVELLVDPSEVSTPSSPSSEPTTTSESSLTQEAEKGA
ncbi:MAG: hypothetical protein EP343_00925 [Deltaproteobacteria bacterium]|nr:MAG: hypothetical protein EP343_00925 [Deltaproteobacteria bacterium]